MVAVPAVGDDDDRLVSGQEQPEDDRVDTTLRPRLLAVARHDGSRLGALENGGNQTATLAHARES